MPFALPARLEAVRWVVSLICLTQLCLAALGQIPPREQIPVAAIGQPFGAFSVDVPLPPDWDGRTPRVLVNDESDRLFFPVVTTLFRDREIQNSSPIGEPRIGRPGGLIDRVRSAIRPASETIKVAKAIKVQGLFRGQGPLVVRLSGDVNQRITFPVDNNRRVSHQELLESWWKSYTDNASAAVAGGDTPKLVQYYLTRMLAHRLNLPTVDIDPPSDDRAAEKNQPLETLQLLAAIEPLREAVLERVLQEPLPIDGMLPVPPEPLWDTAALPKVEPIVNVEPIAGRIPPECFYLRFGSFSNYVWFQEFAERFGGDITQAVFLRGFNYEASARMERMLATQLTTVAKMFGDKLISDLALFGSDLYMKEGASVGVVFQASNALLLKAAMDSERRAVLAKNPDARLTELNVDGVQVSLLSTPDNRIRSFLVLENNYLLISTSHHLVERFLQVSHGEPALGSTEHFRLTRMWMQEQNGYSIFGYFPPDFFHRLVSPQYQIELRRRLEAVAHLELATIASLAAAAEGFPADSLEQLKQAQLLPNWFDQRPDGSKVLRSGNQWVDAQRGARSSFLPIADTQLAEVTASEATEYAKLAEFYQNKWKKMDPLLMGIRRFQSKDGVGETVVFEAHLAPFEPKKYGWIANQLAAPSPIEIRQPNDDAVSLQFHVQGSAPGESYFLFGGLKDMMPPEPDDVKGLIKTLRALKSAPAYIGAWPKPDLVEQLPLGLGAALGRPDLMGFSRMIGGLWRWQDAQWSLLSFDRQMLEKSIPQLATAQTTEQAQARATIANLQGSQLAKWVNALWWERGWRASHGNAELLDAMHQQLKIPANQCLEFASQLLDAKLQCPLGGQYEFESIPAAKEPMGWWNSTAWKAGITNQRGKPIPPEDYRAPWIEWFRGGKIQATQQAASLSVVGLIQLELPPPRVTVSDAENASPLPSLNFDLFSLPLKMFGQESPAEPEAVQRKSF